MLSVFNRMKEKERHDARGSCLGNGEREKWDNRVSEVGP